MTHNSNVHNKIKSYQSKSMDNDLELQLQTKYQKTESLEVFSYKNAIIYPLIDSNDDESNTLYGGVFDDQGKFIQHSLTKRVAPKNMKLTFTDWYGRSGKIHESTIKKINKRVVFLGALPKHYGHFITEGISRLWYELETDDKDIDYVYISEKGSDKFLKLFEILGINQSRIKKINTPSQFSEIIIPEASIRLHDYYHNKYNETISCILKNIPTTVPNKIYLSKKLRFNGRAIGERSIENLFKKNGFKIIYPESYSLIDFLSLIKSSPVVVSSSGSSAHNAIFLKKCSKLICLNRSQHHHPLQIMINEMRDLDVIYVDVSMNFFSNDFSSGPYNFFPTKYLLSFFKDSNFKQPNTRDYINSCSSSFFYIIYASFLGKFINFLYKIKRLVSLF